MNIECPSCKTELRLESFAEFKDDSILTVSYEMKPGHKLAVRDFAKSIMGLADSLKITAKHLGGRVEVFVHDLKVSQNSVEISVQTTRIKGAE